MRKSGILFILYLVSSTLYGQETRTFIPFPAINDLTTSSFNRFNNAIDKSIREKHLLAYFDAGLVRPLSITQFDSLKLRIDQYPTYDNANSYHATTIISRSISEPDSWTRISWQPNSIRVQISEERYFYLDRAKFIQHYQSQNLFFIHQAISENESGEFDKGSLGPHFNRILSELAKKTLIEVLSGKHPISSPHRWDTLFTPNSIRCSLYSTLALVDCDTLELDTLSVGMLIPQISGFAFLWNDQRDSCTFVGKPVKIGLSYHPIIPGIKFPDNPLFWMEYKDFTALTSVDELEILLNVLFERQCIQLSETPED